MARSQQAPDPYAPPPPPLQPGYGPGAYPQSGYGPQAYGYAPRLQLSQEDQELLTRGEINDGQWIVGAGVAIFVGFGLGQAVQGRYGEKGWVFTVGDAASFTALMVGAVDAASCATTPGGACNNNGNSGTVDVLLIGGAVGFGVFRVWEIVDALVAPPAQNAHIRNLRVQLGLPPQQPGYTLAPYIAPARSLRGDTTVGGLQLRF